MQVNRLEDGKIAVVIQIPGITTDSGDCIIYIQALDRVYIRANGEDERKARAIINNCTYQFRCHIKLDWLPNLSLSSWKCEEYRMGLYKDYTEYKRDADYPSDSARQKISKALDAFLPGFCKDKISLFEEVAVAQAAQISDKMGDGITELENRIASMRFMQMAAHTEHVHWLSERELPEKRNILSYVQTARNMVKEWDESIRGGIHIPSVYGP